MQKAKHDVHMRTNKKQKFDYYNDFKMTLSDARKLWKGIFYEADDDDDRDYRQMNKSMRRGKKTTYLNRDEDIC